MVFQNYALYPHMTVYDNIGFALKMAKTPKAERDQRIREAARILELIEQLQKKPGQLSGGQRQRVAMGRAIVRQPSAFLLDEPLSNLDAKLRVQMRAEISGLQRTLGVTTCYVTHDQVEAMTMGDRVAVIKDGVLQQVDAPQDLYDRPDNVFVAAFIGSPSMNLFEGAFSLCEGGATLQVGSQDLLVPHETLGARPALRGYDGRTLIFGIRPEDLADAEVEPLPEEQCLVSEVALVEALGADVLVHLVTEATPVDAGDPDAVDDLAATGVVVARFTPRSRVQMGEAVKVAVNTAGVNFFDSDTRLAIWDRSAG